MNRRELLASAGMLTGTAAAWNTLISPVRAIAADVKAIRIKAIENFTIVIPATDTEVQAGVINRISVIRVVTESGVRGYSFSANPAAAGAGGRGGVAPEGTAGGRSGASFQEVRQALIGTDLFAMEQHLKRGLMDQGALEEALWDAIGKVAGQPLYRLFGGSQNSVPVYVTAPWPSSADQSRVPVKELTAYGRRLKDAGFKAIKITIHRPNFMEDVECCAGIIDACGPAPGFKVMIDRTAGNFGIWNYATGLAAAKALQEAGVYWLEEPFARDDFDSAARLCREVDILITGGEGWRGLDPFREGLVRDAFDIFQPDLNNCGGFWTLRKIAAMCEAFHKPCVGHGATGLRVLGRIHAHAAWGAVLEEFSVIRPPLLPQEHWAPALKIINQKELFTFSNGEVQVPQSPGLGIDLNEEAIEHYRV